MHVVAHKKHRHIPLLDYRYPKGAMFEISGDSTEMWIEDYNVRVSTCATVLEKPGRTAKKVLVVLDEIDGDRNVTVFIKKQALKEENRIDKENE